MQNHPDDLIRCTSFPKSKTTGIWRVSPYKLPIDYYEEKGHSRTRAIVEAILSGDRGDIRVRLHHGIHFEVLNGEVVMRLHPKDLSDIFKCMVEYLRIAWITEDTHREYMIQFQNPNLKPGEK